MSKDGSITEQRNGLHSRIQAWEQLLLIYIPGILQYKAEHPLEPTSEHPEDSILWLPSRIDNSYRESVCRPGLPAIEEKLRITQCTDSLDAMRRILRIKSRMIQFKHKNLRGQRDGTRSRAVIDRVHERARASAEKYRAARAARLALSGPGDWENIFRPLADADVRGFQDANQLRLRKGRKGTLEDDQLAEAGEAGEEGEAGKEGEAEAEGELVLFQEDRSRRDGTGETRRTLSWIWTNDAVEKVSDRSDEVLRSEWAKSRARSKRATEEVMLLKEEMSRVLKYLEWKGDWWMSRSQARPDESPELREGISVFAIKSSKIQLELRESFRKLWDSPLQDASVTTGNKGNDGGNDGGTANDNNDDDDDDDDEDNEEAVVAAAEGGTSGEDV